MFADSQQHHPLPNLFGCKRGISVVYSLADPPGEKSDEQERGNQSGGRQSSRLKEPLPPAAAPCLEPRRDLLPNAPAVVFAWVRNRQRLVSREHFCETMQLRLALRTRVDMGHRNIASGAVTILVSDQLFFT
jgi:hypothetical protein